MTTVTVDIRNPSQAPHVIHDSNKSPITIGPGETKTGVTMDEAAAKLLTDKANADKTGQQLQVTNTGGASRGQDRAGATGATGATGGAFDARRGQDRVAASGGEFDDTRDASAAAAAASRKDTSNRR